MHEGGHLLPETGLRAAVGDAPAPLELRSPALGCAAPRALLGCTRMHTSLTKYIGVDPHLITRCYTMPSIGCNQMLQPDRSFACR